MSERVVNNHIQLTIRSVTVCAAARSEPALIAADTKRLIGLFLAFLAGVVLLLGTHEALAAQRFSRVVQRVESVWSIAILEISIAPNSKMIVSLRKCDDPDYYGCCNWEWRQVNQSYAAKDGSELAELLRQSRVYGGTHIGTGLRSLDGALETLEVTGSDGLVILVVSFNDSFNGDPRGELLANI